MIDMATRRNREHIDAGRAVFEAIALEDVDLGDRRFDKVFAFNVAPFWQRRSRCCSRRVYVVLTTRTEQPALCVTVFGTLPSTRRFIPLLPITNRSAPHSSASRTSTSPASPSSARVSQSIPSLRRSSSMRSRIDFTMADEFEAHCNSTF